MEKLTDNPPKKTDDYAERETARQFTRANVLELERSMLTDALRRAERRLSEIINSNYSARIASGA